MDINFELYKIFYHAARTGNFSEAATHLFITQSAVSQSIKNLETKLGVQLFHRAPRHLRLTQEGELLFSHVEQAYHLLKNAEAKMIELQNLESGAIRIGASDTVSRYLLLPFLRLFNEAHPKLKIQVINRTSLQIIKLLKQATIDFGIVTISDDHPEVKTEFLVEVNDIFVAPGKYGELKERAVPLTDLLQYPLLLLEKSSATRRNFDKFLAERRLAVTPEIELESVDLLVEFARIGLGVAHVLRESALEAMAAGELFEVHTVEAIPLRKLGIAVVENVPLSRATASFVVMLKSELIKKPSATEGSPIL